MDTKKKLKVKEAIDILLRPTDGEHYIKVTMNDKIYWVRTYKDLGVKLSDYEAILKDYKGIGKKVKSNKKKYLFW